jgi:hypothetical protein
MNINGNLLQRGSQLFYFSDFAARFSSNFKVSDMFRYRFTFSILMFTAMLTAVMPGTEHRKLEAPDVSPFRSPMTGFPITGLTPPGSPQSSSNPGSNARCGLSLTCYSGAISAPPYQGQSSRPAASLSARPFPPPGPPFAPHPSPVCTRLWLLPRSGPLQLPRPD